MQFLELLAGLRLELLARLLKLLVLALELIDFLFEFADQLFVAFAFARLVGLDLLDFALDLAQLGAIRRPCHPSAHQ